MEISLQYVFILEKKFTAHCKKEKKVIGHHTRFTIYRAHLWEFQPGGKSRHVLMCAVRMRKAVLGITLNSFPHQAKGRCRQHPTPAAPGIDTKSNRFFHVVIEALST